MILLLETLVALVLVVAAWPLDATRYLIVMACIVILYHLASTH